MKVQKMREAWMEKGDKVMVGQDKYGNTYWETKGYTEVSRDRWVEYSSKVERIYEPTQVPSEWHGWLHHRRDEPPTSEQTEGQTKDTPKGCKQTHNRNLSGTRDQYFPPHNVLNPDYRPPSATREHVLASTWEGQPRVKYNPGTYDKEGEQKEIL
eukprot:CAMPEP_0117428348 /NCGR_PEP_ID=MMETSP0758-20121206/8084_1 /TAXON_ID=63605 /ORGANISM="Percolomonas cosmopolitus, Strain AE-1 (ATCC 50343)" /LENGTH=154 /DNA_ID=CAMNT_0005214671 /DNA_START=44 /DNA_END=508 /DNA_ORIENTATION=+